MIDFFTTQKCKIYVKQITPKGAGDFVEWVEDRTIKVYLDPIDGEKLLSSGLGNKNRITLMMYSRSKISNGERVLVPFNSDGSCELFEIQQCEFYKMPFFSYYKGYLVKTDENL